MTSLCSRSSADAVRTVEHPAPISYEQFAASCDTGDLVFEYGASMFARIIEFIGRTPFSHVALVDKTDARTLWLWESVFHRDECVCVLQKRASPGVRLVYGEPRIESMLHGARTVRIARRALRCDDAARARLATTMHTYEHRMFGTPYEQDPLTLLQCRYPALFGRPRDDPCSMMCTELVMRTLQEAGAVETNALCTVSLTAMAYGNASALAMRRSAYTYADEIHVFHVQAPVYDMFTDLESGTAAAAAASPPEVQFHYTYAR